MDAINKFKTDQSTLAGGKNIGVDPWSTPQYLSNENLNYATSADASANAGRAGIQDLALRTGDNSASSIEGIKNMQRESQRTANSALNMQKTQDYNNNVNYQQALLQSDLGPTGASNSLYGTATSGRDAALNNLTQFGLASYQPWTSAIGAAGAAAGAAFAPGGAATKAIGCWIAEAIYGTDDARTHLVRSWLNTEFTKKPVGKAVMALYQKVGRGVAAIARRSSLTRRALKPLFDAALRRAEASRTVFVRRNWWDACLPLLVRGD